MESFENLFRDEVDYLQQLAEYMANDSPHLSDFLPNSGDHDMARLMEGFSVLIASLRQKIEEDFPEITQNLLANVWPLPLRAIPSTSILRFSSKKHCVGSGTKDVIASGSACATINGVAVAQMGDSTAHGGVSTQGEAGLTLT